MNSCKNIFFAATLALTGAAPLFAGPAVYGEAAAPWTAAQAVKLPPAITPEFLKEVARNFGPEAAAGLAVKKEKVAALVNRLKSCGLSAEDLNTADKYFTPDFKAELRRFAEQGCAADVKPSAAASGPAAARSASLDRLETLSVSGSLATYAGAAKFFDGSASKGAVAVPAAAAAGQSRPSGQASVQAPAAKPLSSNVPALRSASPVSGGARIERPADLGLDGRVNQALAYWTAMRRENWAAYKNGDLSGAARAKAFLKAAAGGGFGGLLTLSNLPQVEIAAARLGWDSGQGASAAVIAGDSVKLAFHAGVFALALAPIPISKVLRAAAAGEAWAITMSAAIASGPVNRYVVRVF
ncbi:MAG: hypothetical protein WCK76_06980 [Elusimicrobiota bacterium]